MAYAQLIESRELWEPAADAYVTGANLIELTRRNADLLPMCYERAAHCLSKAKLPIGAHELLKRGIEIATDQVEGASKRQNEDEIARLRHWLVRMQIAMGMVSGELLERSSAWKDAAEIYVGTIELMKAHPSDRAHLLPCYERAAYCLRQIGQIDRAEGLLDDGIGVALELRDTRWSLYLRISRAVVARQKGDLPIAEQELDAIIDDARHSGEREMLARARHERGAVAYERNQFERAAEYFYAAAREHADQYLSRRALMDLALALSELGHLDYARTVYRVLQSAPDDGFESRIVARLNLMRLAMLANDRQDFDQVRTEIEGAEMTGRLRAHFWLFAGQGFRRFGEPKKARKAFEEAIVLAEQHHVYKLLVEAEAMLASTDERSVAWKGPEESPALKALFQDIDARRGLFAGAT